MAERSSFVRMTPNNQRPVLVHKENEDPKDVVIRQEDIPQDVDLPPGHVLDPMKKTGDIVIVMIEEDLVQDQDHDPHVDVIVIEGLRGMITAEERIEAGLEVVKEMEVEEVREGIETIVMIEEEEEEKVFSLL